MATASIPPLGDVAILTRAVENVFRKLIRMLIGRMSLKKLQQMIQIIFVEEAEAKLKREEPGKNVSLATLAVVTGFDTRTITKIKAEESYQKPFFTEERFLSEITPECSVLDVWESNSKYLDPKTGKPLKLKLKGPEKSFEALINDAISTRGVTAKSFLQSLVASKSILVDEDRNEVQMIDKKYTPFESEDQTANVKVGMAAVGNLVETITHNLNAPTQKEGAFYQQGCWTNRLNKDDRLKLRELVREFLDQQDDQARRLMKPFEQEIIHKDQVTAGISMFYFEEELQS